MKRIAIALVAVLGCGKSDSKANPAPASAPAAAAAAAAAAAVAPPATPPTPAAEIDPCSLVSAAEVGAAIGKTVIANKDGPRQCSYGLDPAEQQKGMDELRKGGLAGMVKGGGIKVPSVITNQLALTLEISPKQQSEAEIKQVYAGLGSAVDKLDPKAHGLDDAIKHGQELHGLGDWAFTTNIAAVNMGNGISTRGRLLHAQRGAWQLTLSVTIAPDPGAAQLDDELVAIAKVALTKLN
ncbi:MAG: hypothetical protein ABI467_28295 [Kofleriaceae bacterium]